MLAKHKHTNIPTMMEPFALPVAWFCQSSIPHPPEPLRKGLAAAAVELKGFSRINKLNEKIIYFLLPLHQLTAIACPPSAMIAKTTFIAVGGPP